MILYVISIIRFYILSWLFGFICYLYYFVRYCWIIELDLLSPWDVHLRMCIMQYTPLNMQYTPLNNIFPLLVNVGNGYKFLGQDDYPIHRYYISAAGWVEGAWIEMKLNQGDKRICMAFHYLLFIKVGPYSTFLGFR